MNQLCVKCRTECENEALPIRLKLNGRTFAGVCEGWRCESCLSIFYAGPSAEAFEQNCAEWLARYGAAAPDELKFMRKVAGIRAADLARWGGISPETVSRWETGKNAPNRLTLYTLRALVLEALRGEKSIQDTLQALATPEPALEIRFD
jgi:DNA-binding transcriptional regulator YiaG